MEYFGEVQIIKSVEEMQRVADAYRNQGKKIAFVPTMGYLHEGHLSLIKLARTRGDVVITSIFVNPTQFGPNEDYNRYPRDFNRDKQAAREAGTDIIFYPDVDEIYPPEFNSYVEVEGISNILEGKFRPNHFKGVATIVLKLLNITKPHIVVFGQKDVQQAFIIKKMVKDLNFDADVIIAPIVREKDGLAMSSRNTYLSNTERSNATVLYKALEHAKKRIIEGERSVNKLRNEMMEILKSGSPSQIDYIAFIDTSAFKEVENIELPEILIAVAVKFGKTRLIDNCIMKVNG